MPLVAHSTRRRRRQLPFLQQVAILLGNHQIPQRGSLAQDSDKRCDADALHHERPQEGVVGLHERLGSYRAQHQEVDQHQRELAHTLGSLSVAGMPTTMGEYPLEHPSLREVENSFEVESGKIQGKNGSIGSSWTRLRPRN